MSASDVNTRTTVNIANVTVTAGPSSTTIATDDGFVVGAADTALVAANAARTELVIVNDSVNVIYLRKGATAAVIGKGIRLNPNGGSYVTNTWKGAVRAIAAAAGSNVTVSDS